MIEFEEFPKMARWSRDIVVTEKIDGSNGAVLVAQQESIRDKSALWQKDGLAVYAQSRFRFITPEDDNFGFAVWVMRHAEELAVGLGVGRHFGEWWGAGIQRRYGLAEKRFSLFNTARWGEVRPACCHVVPVLYSGMNEAGVIEGCLGALEKAGSIAAPGFMDPEGVVIFHTAANFGFKKTLKRDEVPKSFKG